MKKCFFAALAAGILLIAATSCENTVEPSRKKPPEKELPDPEKEPPYPGKEPVDIEKILSLMSTEEKIRQMVQVEQNKVSGGAEGSTGLSDQWYGSVLSGVGETPSSAEGGNTPLGWVTVTNCLMKQSLNPKQITVNVTGEGAAGNGLYSPKTPIPYLHGIDAVHGMTHMPGTTVLPHAAGLGAIAAGNLERGKMAVFDSCRITARETGLLGIRWTFALVLGNAENARWGRF